MPYDERNQERPKITRRMNPLETRNLRPECPKQPIPAKRKQGGFFQFLQDHPKLTFSLGMILMLCLLIISIPLWNSFSQKNNIQSKRNIQNSTTQIQSTYNYSVGANCESFGEKGYSENKVDAGHTLVVGVPSDSWQVVILFETQTERDAYLNSNSRPQLPANGDDGQYHKGPTILSLMETPGIEDSSINGAPARKGGAYSVVFFYGKQPTCSIVENDKLATLMEEMKKDPSLGDASVLSFLNFPFKKGDVIP